MKIFAFSLFCLTFLWLVCCEEEDEIVDQIVASGNFPDILEGEPNLSKDREKILKENGLDKLDPIVIEECKDLAGKFLQNSEELRKIVEEVRATGKLDLKHRKDIIVCMWKEYKRNKKLYKPQIKEIFKKLPSETKIILKRKLSKLWKSLKGFFKHPVASLTGPKKSHSIKKREIVSTILLTLMAGLFITMVMVFMITSIFGGYYD